MSRDEWLYVEDIHACCQKVLRYTAGMTFAQFRADEKTFDAVVRNLEIIGEAAKHLSPAFRERYPEGEWRSMAGFRDIAIHACFSINAHIVWDIVAHEVPQPLEQVSRIMTRGQAGDDTARH